MRVGNTGLKDNSEETQAMTTAVESNVQERKPSMIDGLPNYVRETILSGDPYHKPENDPSKKCSPRLPARDDLMMIPTAEAAGWVVSFRNGSWHNCATFTKGRLHVWTTARDWRSATLGEDNRFTKPVVFPNLRAALAFAA